MRLEQIKPSTPAYQVMQTIGHRPADENEKWSDGFYDWENVRLAHREAMKEAAKLAQPPLIRKEGKGILVVGGGIYLPSAYTAIKLHRRKSDLPGELFYIGKDEMDEFHVKLFADLGFTVTDVTENPEWDQMRMIEQKEKGWLAKPFALRHTKFAQVAAFDADCYTVNDPGMMFGETEFTEKGAIFFPDVVSHDLSVQKWAIFGMPSQNCRCFESGQMWVDTKRHWRPLALCLWMNDHLDFYYRFFWGDKETFCIAFRYLGIHYSIPPCRPCAVEGQVLLHYDFNGAPLTIHRCRAKFTTVEGEARKWLFWNTLQTGVHHKQYFAQLPREAEAHKAFKEYQELILCR